MASDSADWRASLDLSRLSWEDRYKLLEYVIGKAGRDSVQETLGISRITMWRLLNRQGSIDDDKLRILL